MLQRFAHLRPRRAARTLVAAAILFFGFLGHTAAHPLGGFTTNHYARIEVTSERVRVRYVVDMAEISTFQELQSVDTDGDGTPSSAEFDAYLERIATHYADGLALTVDNQRIKLTPMAKKISTPPGEGNLPLLRVECDFEGALPSNVTDGTHTLRFEDTNHQGRIGWREAVVKPIPGVAVFNSSAFSNGLTDELKAYPEDMLTAPLNERVVEFSFVKGEVPAGAAPLRSRDGRPTAQSRDWLAELIAVPEITPGIALLALLVAVGLGAIHALSPGHGKAVVGAYLVGSRGTPRHAVFLGVTVTITHTISVFALGLVTLFASQFILPERIFPLLSLVSGLLVLSIGLTLLAARLRAMLRGAPDTDPHDRLVSDEPTGLDQQSQPREALDHDHSDHNSGLLVHSHGGRVHSHLPPTATRVTWRSLLALGVSGGLLPCPSALVVMLSAISLGHVGFGLLLVLAFSLGLAGTLTGVGLAFLYANRFINLPSRSAGLARVLPVVSAFVIAGLGAAICYEAILQTREMFGFSFADLFAGRRTLYAGPATSGIASNSLSTVLVLAFGGLILGLKHAIDADHVAAVSTIVSERKTLLSSSLVGGLWGIGHTLSLLIAGIIVLTLRVQISERTEMALEFGVGLMLIALGVNALVKLARGGRLHVHPHRHGTHTHIHPHIHQEGEQESGANSHHGFRIGARPLVVGMVHGLAGSAALMLIVLSTIESPLIGLIYIAVFGLGSIGGMMLMSALVGLPMWLTANRFSRANLMLRGLAGLFSVCFGLFMVYEIGFTAGLFR